MEPSLLGLEELKGKKNLLAFSAGSDSSALFFLLKAHNISFDLAIVDHNLRPQSKEEVAYAKELAHTHKKRLFTHSLSLPKSNIEHEARLARYRFFEQVIAQEGYDTLITAHHLADLFEWFLMQLAKGAGAAELVGMEPIEQRAHYLLVRPLLLTPKDEIMRYLHQHNIPFFHDKSNEDTRFWRNHMRQHFTKEFLSAYKEGVKRSFGYLLEDKKLLEPTIYSIKSLHLAQNPKKEYQRKRVIDRLFKKVGYILSSRQKEEILHQGSGVIAGKIAFGIDERLIMVAPYKKVRMDKKTKELLRTKKIPPPLRGYIYTEHIELATIQAYRDRDRK